MHHHQRSFARGLALALVASSSATLAQTAPVTETKFGITTVDDHRWMEDPARKADLETWVNARSVTARAALAALPMRAAFLQELKSVSSDLTRVSGYTAAGDVAVFRRAKVGDRTPKLFIRTPAGERLLFDPDPGAPNPVRSITSVSLSPNGKHVAVNLSSAGGEVGTIDILDTATGKSVATIDRIWGEFPIYWLGGDRIGYTQLAPDGSTADPLQNMRLYVRSLRGRDAPVPVLGAGLTEGFAAADFPIVDAPKGSSWAAGLGVGARADQRLWIARSADLRAGNPKWIKLTDLDDKVGSWAFIGDRLALLSTKNNGYGAVTLHTIAADGKLGSAKEVVKGTDRLMVKNIWGDSTGLYFEGSSDGAARLFFVPNGDGQPQEIKLPFESGELYQVSNDPSGDGLTFALQGWLTNTRIFRADGSRLSDTGLASSTWAGAKDFAVERLSARSADGTDVPLVVVRKAGALPAGGMPTLLDSYGGYGISSATAFYNRNAMAFIAKGGALAYCGVRGGGERGRPWHEAGRGLNKANGHADLIACAETLKARGISTPRGPVATGASMGGALVPPAALKKPEAFAGMIPMVGILNATRIGAAQNGANQFAEMGDPATAEGYRSLMGMDAYQMLRTAKDMPDTLVTIGLTDNRVAPWMSAKFAARAADRFPQRSVWLRADSQAGHGIGSAEEDVMALAADIYAFAWDRSQPR